jgi:hypothetical protein
MDETDPLKNGLHKGELAAPVAVCKLLSTIVVAEVAVETNLWESLGDLHGPPRVLGNRGAMRFDDYEQAVRQHPASACLPWKSLSG